MLLTQFLAPENIHYDVVVSSKKRLLELIGKIASEIFNQQIHNEIVCPVECFTNLFKREKLGCTYINNGIAMPHTKLAMPTEVEAKPIAIFLKLESPIHYETDEKEVDLVYALLFPEGSCEQYRADFQAITQALNDKNLAKQLRATKSADEIWQVLEYTDKQASEEAN